MEQHIDQCVECQTRLQELAADQFSWETVRRSFGETHDISGVPTEVGDHRNSAAMSSWEDYQFLEPHPDKTKLGMLGNIEILSVIGKGGMGVVFKGYEPSLKRFVAVKVLSPEHAINATSRARFGREAESVAAVVNDYVVPIHAVQADHAPPYLVMSFVPGGSLQERIDRLGFLSPSEIIRIAHQIAMGLAAAHARGIVHRDIKPANVLLEDGMDRVKLTDFGLARSIDDVALTRLGAISGTPQYMSPEQALGGKVDFRSDLFSLGVTVYCMGTGVLPFRGNQSLSVMNQVCRLTPPLMQEHNPSIPAWLDNLVLKLIEKDPDKRFQSAGEVAELLEDCLAHVQQPTLVPIPVAVRPSRKPKVSMWLVALLASSVLVVAAFMWNEFQKRGIQIHEPQDSAEASATSDLATQASGKTETFWLPGQLIPGENHVFSFDQGILRGHVFARAMDDGRVLLVATGLDPENKIQAKSKLRLISEQDVEIPLNSCLFTRHFQETHPPIVGFMQRTRDPLRTPALISVEVTWQTDQKPEADQ